MTTYFFSVTQLLSMRARASKRWIGLFFVSIALHLLLLDWASGYLSLPTLRQDDAVITAELQVSPVIDKSRIAPASRQPVSKLRTPSISSPANIASSRSTLDFNDERASSSIPVGMETPGTSVESETELSSGVFIANKNDQTVRAAIKVADSSPTDSTSARYRIDLPPSAELQYDVQALREGRSVYGHGTIDWQYDGNRYTVIGEAGILFFTALNFKSEGMIDDLGIAPLLYSEKRRGKSETNTHFHRERNTISFSASTVAYPRIGGAQDRASIIWQLAGIGRGDSEKIFPGAEIDIFVAGVRDAETWRLRIIGQEDIALDNGHTLTWHVVRTPRPGSYEQKLDIWFAPQQNWYPVKLRYTDVNGDYLDMLLSKVNPAATH